MSTPSTPPSGGEPHPSAASSTLASAPDEHDAAEPSGATLGGNAAITVSTQIAVLVFGLVASALISRALGPEGRGSYYVPVTTVTTTFALLHLSLEMSTTYHFTNRLESIARLAQVATTASMSAGLIGLMALSVPYVVDPGGSLGGMRNADLALAALALPFIIHSSQLMNLFVLSGRLPRSQLVVVIVAVAQTLALVALGIADLFSVGSVLTVYVGTAVLNWLLLVLWSRRFAPARPTTDRAVMRRVVGHGLRLHAAYVAFFLLLRSDVYLVDAKLGLHEVGLYSLAVLFAELVWTVASSLALAALPFQTVEDEDEGAAATLQIVRICFFIAAMLALGCILTLWWFLPFFYGREFAGVYGPMVVLLPGVVAMTVVRPLWNGLLRHGRTGRIVALFVSGFALNIALNLVLLPAIGLYGASVASSISYALLASVLAYWTLQHTDASPRDLFPGSGELAAGKAVLARLRPSGGGPASAGQG